MEMVIHEEEPETSVYQNFRAAPSRDDASKSCSGEDSKVTAAAPGFKLFRLVALSFGLLCILQAVLNISLHLTLISQRNSLREERDQLEKTNSDAETRYKSLIDERDMLKRNVNVISSQHDSLIRQTEHLTRELNSLGSQRVSLTHEREHFKSQLTILSSQYDSLSRESEKLKKGLSTLARNFGCYHFNGSAYYISSDRKNWQESREDCIQKGADLVTINSKEEQNFVRRLSKKVWIGLTDLTLEGAWKWVDGSPLTISYWDRGEPNGGTNENCVEANFLFYETTWNDIGCSTKLHWICEKKVSP